MRAARSIGCPRCRGSGGCGARCSDWRRATKDLVLEDKGETLALHYRQAPRLASHLHRAVRAEVALGRDAPVWRLQTGKGLIEVRPDGRDKGTAISRIT